MKFALITLAIASCFSTALSCNDGHRTTALHTVWQEKHITTTVQVQRTTVPSTVTSTVTLTASKAGANGTPYDESRIWQGMHSISSWGLDSVLHPSSHTYDSYHAISKAILKARSFPADDTNRIKTQIHVLESAASRPIVHAGRISPDWATEIIATGTWSTMYKTEFCLKGYGKLQYTMEKINKEVWPRHYLRQQTDLLALEQKLLWLGVRWLTTSKMMWLEAKAMEKKGKLVAKNSDGFFDKD